MHIFVCKVAIWLVSGHKRLTMAEKDEELKHACLEMSRRQYHGSMCIDVVNNLFCMVVVVQKWKSDRLCCEEARQKS